MKIAFIGLGVMGKPMALNLLKGGHSLVVCDHHLENLTALAAAGAKTAATPAEATAQCPLVITMLPDSPQVLQVATGENGILQAIQEGGMFVDMSSVAPETSKGLARLCALKKVLMLDAPVSGGEPKAIDASLSIMAGGDEALFEQLKENVLLKMGASAIYCGPAGAGNTTKLANQIIVAANIAACAEAFAFVKKAGLSAETVWQAIRGGLAGSTVMEAKFPMMLKNNYTPGFRVDLHVKDLKNALQTGQSLKAPLPLAAHAMDVFLNLQAHGEGGLDHSAMLNAYLRLSAI
ncbi:MAG: 2-hydroxy-3-oxopropionate reductase [Oscillospiraceae bacterium]